MAQFTGIILTNKGRNLQAKAEAGAALAFTKMKLGDGQIAQGQSLETLNDLVHPLKILPISSVQAEDNGLCRIRSNITNAGVEAGFFIREIGLFATDPDLGEILYAITTATAPDYLPPEGGATVVNNQFDVLIAVGNASNITATIAPGGLVSVDDLVASKVTIADAGNHFAATDVEGAMQELAGEVDTLKSSGADGKARIAAAIIRKRGTVAGTAPHSFLELEEGVDSIPLGTGNAQPPDVLDGKTFSNDDGPDKVGTMQNNGAVTITPGMADVAIPAGYHDGLGKVLGGNYRVGDMVHYTKLGLPSPPVTNATPTDANWLRGVATDASGNVFICKTNGTLEKYSPAGQLLASVASASTYTHIMKMGPDGFIYVGQSITTTQGNLFKYDTDLIQQWAIPTGAGIADIAFSNGHVYGTGGTATSNNGTVKHRMSDGGQVWKRTSGQNEGRRIAVEPGGAFYYIGTYDNVNSSDRLIKYDEATGAVVWNKTRSDADTYSLACDDGRVLCGPYMYDGAGTSLWTAAIGGFPKDAILQRTADGGGAFITTGSPNGGLYYIDSNGLVQWSVTHLHAEDGTNVSGWLAWDKERDQFLSAAARVKRIAFKMTLTQ